MSEFEKMCEQLPPEEMRRVLEILERVIKSEPSLGRAWQMRRALLFGVSVLDERDERVMN